MSTLERRMNKLERAEIGGAELLEAISLGKPGVYRLNAHAPAPEAAAVAQALALARRAAAWACAVAVAALVVMNATGVAA